MLSTQSRALDTLSGDLAQDAVTIARHGKAAASAAPDDVGHLAETVLAAIGGAVTGGSTLVEGLSVAVSQYGERLVKVTGGVG